MARDGKLDVSKLGGAGAQPGAVPTHDGATVKWAVPAGGGLSHATAATQRRAWLGTSGSQTVPSSGITYVTWAQAGELKTGAPSLGGAALNVDWVLWDPANPTVLQVKQDGFYTISYVLSVTFTNSGDALQTYIMTSTGNNAVTPTGSATPATYSQCVASGGTFLEANETIRVYKTATKPAGGAATGTVTITGGNLEIMQIC